MKIGRRAVALTPLAMGLAAACGGGNAGTGSGGTSGGTTGTAPGGGDKPVDGAGKKLTVWIMEGTNKDAKPFFEQVAAKFKEQTKADLDVQYVPWANAHDKIVSSIAGNAAPDVCELGTTYTPEFAETGALMDLTDRVKTAGGTAPLNKALVEAGTVDGKLWGMPWYAGIRSFIYRKDLFQTAGVKEPTNWKELVEAGKKLKAANPSVAALPVAGDAELTVYPWIWGAGGEIATQDGKKWKSAIDSPKSREGIKFWTDLAVKEQLSLPAATTWKETNLRDEFIKGTVAMTLSGSWTPAAIIAKDATMKDKMGVFAIPGKDSGMSPSFAGGSHLGIFDQSKNKDLAWAFVKLMSYGEFAEKWAKESSFFPGQNEPLKKLIDAKDPLVTPFAKQFTDAAKSTPVTPLYGKVQGAKVIQAMIQSILSGKASVEQATSTAAAEMNKQLGAG